MELNFALVMKAATYAERAHRGQVRKDAEASPYITHPLEVARILADEGGVTDPAVLVAALLHDTIEDCAKTAGELASLFGADVAAIVVELGDDKSLEKDERKRLQIRHAPHKSPRAALVKIADKIANVRDVTSRPPQWTARRRIEYIRWAESVVAGLPPTNKRLLQAFGESVRAFDALGLRPE